MTPDENRNQLMLIDRCRRLMLALQDIHAIALTRKGGDPITPMQQNIRAICGRALAGEP